MMMILGWESRILLVSAWYSSRNEEAVLLQDKDCRETTFLDCLLHVAWSKPSKEVQIWKYLYTSEPQEKIWFWMCRDAHHYQHLLEEVIFQVQEIYRTTCYRLKMVCQVYGWCQKMIDIDGISCCCCTNIHHMQYPRIEFVKSDAWYSRVSLRSMRYLLQLMLVRWYIAKYWLC